MDVRPPAENQSDDAGWRCQVGSLQVIHWRKGRRGEMKIAPGYQEPFFGGVPLTNRLMVSYTLSPTSHLVIVLSLRDRGTACARFK